MTFRVMRRTLAAIAIALAACARPSPNAPVPVPAPPADLQGAFTKRVAFAILEDYEKDEDLREVERDFRLFRELGITTWRGAIAWDDHEPRRGEYDFRWLHRFAALAREHDITLRPWVGYTPGWAAVGRRADGHAWNDPPRDLGDWERFVGALAGAMRRHRHVASWELYNEQNVALWWDGSAAEYDSVLARGARAVRRASPGALVFAGGLVWPDAAWLEGQCAALPEAAAMDVVALHAYPETWTPDSVRVENWLDAGYRGAFLRAVDGACGRRPVWINEAGFATSAGRTERQQADWWVRAIATFLADRRVEHVGVYEIKDLRPASGVAVDAPSFHLGLTYADRRKKLAFHAVRTMVALLDTETLTVADASLELAAPKGSAARVRRHLFLRPDGRQVLVAWTTGAPVTVSFTFPRAAGRLVRHLLDGSAVPAAAFDGRVARDVRLERGEPVILEAVP